MTGIRNPHRNPECALRCGGRTSCAVPRASPRVVPSDTQEDRQRAALFEVRGLRFADTVLLTLSVGMLNVFMGIRCQDPSISCEGREGFDAVLFLAVLASLVSATLCYITLDVNDRRLTLELSKKVRDERLERDGIRVSMGTEPQSWQM